MKSNELKIKLTVYFEAPFWVGVFEKSCENEYEVSKFTFGSEPKDYEVYDFILKNYYNLKFSKPMFSKDKNNEDRVNPKRLKKKINKELLCNQGIGTKAQQAMKIQYEANKVEYKKASREFKEAEKARKFQLKQDKKKEKHKGH